LANPAAPIAGVPKMAAMTALTGAYLETVARELDPSLGSAARLARVAAEVFGREPEPSAAVAAVHELLADWGLARCLQDIGLDPADAPRLTSAARELWGAPELLGRVAAETCEAIYRAGEPSWCAG
jgi:hypothetical protein